MLVQNFHIIVKTHYSNLNEENCWREQFIPTEPREDMHELIRFCFAPHGNTALHTYVNISNKISSKGFVSSSTFLMMV